MDVGADHETRLSSVEVGLLTIAERRGCVRTPRKVDERNDPADIERLAVLHRLVERGLMIQRPTPEDSKDLEFVLTPAGGRAIEAADAAPAAQDH